MGSKEERTVMALARAGVPASESVTHWVGLELQTNYNNFGD